MLILSRSGDPKALANPTRQPPNLNSLIQRIAAASMDDIDSVNRSWRCASSQ
jgi:hypothetical protein